MALVAAHCETGEKLVERDALEWLESQRPPALVVSDADLRDTVNSYVPVNDVRSLPADRPRQKRQFPTALPHDATVLFLWDTKPTDQLRDALASLCRKVTYLGHSSSPVQVWVEPNPPEPNLVPVGQRVARYRLRVGGAGRLAELKARFEAGQRPTSSLWVGYDRPQPTAPQPAMSQTCFDGNLVVLRRVEGRPLGLESTLLITQALRDTVMSLCEEQPPPEWISGHRSDGARSEQDHLAFLPLPHVGREHADGHLLGLGIAVPRNVTAEQQAEGWSGVLFDDLGAPKQIELRLGNLGVWRMELDDREQREVALRPETWALTPSRRWATVTPIAFDRHPKGPDKWKDIEQAIARACGRIGLPAPAEVILSLTSMFIGAPTARSFPLLKRKADGGHIHHSHAVITFPEPVIGPVLLGAGRYRGYGLCRPLSGPEVVA
jgi:CRISPR-associated protein Csb2